MMKEEIAWECECGNIEYTEIPPQECDKCYKIDSFIQLSEELVNERAKDIDLELDESELAPMKVKKSKNKSVKAKSSSKSTKTKGRKSK